jgi:hypothetical protein
MPRQSARRFAAASAVSAKNKCSAGNAGHFSLLIPVCGINLPMIDLLAEKRIQKISKSFRNDDPFWGAVSRFCA